MKRHGPLLTLLTGLVFAIVLTGLSARAAKKETTEYGRAAQNSASSSPATPAASPSVVATKSPGQTVTATWAGSVTGGAASIAIAARSGGAVAYLCDGKRVEAWLLGSAVDGKLNLTGKNNSSLTGTFGNGFASGTVVVGAKQWTFKVPVVTAPSGLYRATATVRNAKIVGGWIVVNGQITGGISRDDVSVEPTELNLANRTTVVDGTTLPVTFIQGSSDVSN
jgi:hypothetical protein